MTVTAVPTARKQDLTENVSRALWSIKGWRISDITEEQRTMYRGGTTGAGAGAGSDAGVVKERITRSYRNDILRTEGGGKLYPLK